MLATESFVSRQELAVSVRRAAALLGVSEDSVYQKVRAGELPHKRLGRRIIIPRAALERWLDKADFWDADGRQA